MNLIVSDIYDEQCVVKSLNTRVKPIFVRPTEVASRIWRRVWKLFDYLNRMIVDILNIFSKYIFFPLINVRLDFIFLKITEMLKFVFKQLVPVAHLFFFLKILRT